MARSKILGPDGQPVDLDALFSPAIAGPTLTGVRSPVASHPAEGLTATRLSALHRAAARGEPREYFELAEDIEERDLHYAAVLSTRKRAIAQLPLTVEAASDDANHIRHADFVRSWLRGGLLARSLFHVLDAVGKGYSITEIEWCSTPDQVAPVRLTWRNPAWFALADADIETPLLLDGVSKQPLPPHRFIVHRHPAKSGLTIRSGLTRAASWAWMYKAFTLRDWAVFCQNYGMPVRLGRYDNGASDADRRVLRQAVFGLAGDCAAILPKSMDIEFREVGSGTGKGADLYEKRGDWMDRQVSKLVLGQTTTTDAVSGGHAVAKEHRLVQEDIERADAILLSASLTDQLVQSMVAFQFGPQSSYPRLLIGRPDETPLAELVDALDRLGPQGLTVEVSQIRDRLGFDDPAPDAEVIGGRQSAPKAKSAMQRLMAFQQSVPGPDHVERLTARLAQDASGALAGLTDEIRQIFATSADLHQAAERLRLLQLDPAELAAAMQRGLALAHLAGQAALLDDLKP